jgi:cobalt-precorrin-5B (C1)-methyltransferase
MTDLGYTIVDGKRLKKGYTTGSCAAGAAKAAAQLYFNKELPQHVSIDLPSGGTLTLQIVGGELSESGAKCGVIKDGGDDPDVTHGLQVWVEVVPEPGKASVTFMAGPGVGTVTKYGLPVQVGEPAINPVPRQMIANELAQVLPPNWGASVIVSVPGGEEAARKTLNPKLGVVGGISILGTTGIVNPMSEEAFKTSLVPQLIQAKTLGFKTLVLVPGRIGAKRASEIYGIPSEATAEMSNFVGFMLMECRALGFKEVILMGHISKLIKVAAGVFHTHNRVADARFETLATHCALLGMCQDDLQTLMDHITIEGALDLVEEKGFQAVYPRLAAQVSKRATEHTYGELQVGTVLLNMAGQVLGMDEPAKHIAKGQSWNIIM